MDNPFVIALLVFFGVFIMFFVISLLSDLLIVMLTLGSAFLAYFIPDWYPVFYEQVVNTPVANFLGLVEPAQLDAATTYVMGGLVVLTAALLSVPVLPFSATYRQILGANRIGRQDEAYILSLVQTELKNHAATTIKPAKKAKVADPYD